MTASHINPHPACEIFPAMNPDGLAGLTEDIRQHGLREPIWLHPDGRIIDGRNRYAACQASGVTPAFRTWDGQGSLVAFVLSLNLHRRHLDESQRAIVAARAKGLFEQEARARQIAELKQNRPVGANLRQRDIGQIGRSNDKAAAMFNVSPRSVAMASKVIASGSPELVSAVQQGAVSVSAACTIAHLPKPEQVHILTAGQREIVAKANEIRAAKKPKPVARPSTVRRPSAEDLLSARVLELVQHYERETDAVVLSLSVARDGAASSGIEVNLLPSRNQDQQIKSATIARDSEATQ